jgi:hypothetical protein
VARGVILAPQSFHCFSREKEEELISRLRGECMGFMRTRNLERNILMSKVAR